MVGGPLRAAAAGHKAPHYTFCIMADNSFKKRLTRYLEKTSLKTHEVKEVEEAEEVREPDPPSLATVSRLEVEKESHGVAGERKKRILELRAQLDEIANKHKASPPVTPSSSLPFPGPGEEDEAVGDVDEIETETAAPPQADRPVLPGEPQVPGMLVATDHGDIWVHETRVDLRDRYGSIFLMDAFLFSGEMAALLGGSDDLYGFDPRRAVYLDTETTGLELSTATIPFLIGVGMIEGDHLVLRQIFIDRLEKEASVLRYLSDLLEGYDQLVTFNGKTYDIPLIKTRYIFNRLDTDMDGWLHFDLLHAARKLFKRRIGDCSLVSCERQVLGFMREGDIPGDEIPQIYVSFLQDSRSDLMPTVFHHNVQDIVAMVALLGSIALLLESHSEEFEAVSPDDLLSLAKVGIKRGKEGHAERIWDHTSESCEGNRKVESLVGLARLARRRQDSITASRLMEMALTEESDSAPLHLMLSKIYEHDIRDFERALQRAYSSWGAEDEQQWEKRIKRIERKLEKSKEKPERKQKKKPQRKSKEDKN